MNETAAHDRATPRGFQRSNRVSLLVIALGGALVASVAGALAVHVLYGGDNIDVRLARPGEYIMPAPERLSQVGERFPDVDVTSADGHTVRTGSLVGPILVVHLWYSSCVPCVRSLDDVARVHNEYRELVRFVGINPVDDLDTMLAVATERKLAYELYRDDEIRFIGEIDPISYPMTLFVAPDGIIVDQTGEIDADGLRARIEAMLADPPR